MLSIKKIKISTDFRNVSVIYSQHPSLRTVMSRPISDPNITGVSRFIFEALIWVDRATPPPSTPGSFSLNELHAALILATEFRLLTRKVLTGRTSQQLILGLLFILFGSPQTDRTEQNSAKMLN